MLLGHYRQGSCTAKEEHIQKYRWSIVLIAVIRALLFLDVRLVWPAILPHNFEIIVPLPDDIVFETVALLSGIVKGGFFCDVVEVGDEPIEIFIYLLLLIFDLLVLGLPLATAKLCPLLVFEDVDQLPPSLEVDFVLVVPHRSQALLRIVHLQLP